MTWQNIILWVLIIGMSISVGLILGNLLYSILEYFLKD